jgi:uncharacterized protein (DUF885 family)
MVKPHFALLRARIECLGTGAGIFQQHSFGTLPAGARIGFVNKIVLVCACMSLFFTPGCGDKGAPGSFLPTAEQFVYSSLAFSPISATMTGYHRHKGANLDEMLDDISPAGFEKQRQFYQAFHDSLSRIDPAKLIPQDRADYDIVSDQVALNLLELETIQNYKHNPTVYVEAAGNAIFGPHVLQYAPPDQRVRHIIARLEKMPEFLDQAKKNLVDSPEIWTSVAIEENEGNMALIDKEVRAGVPQTMRADYDRAAGTALEALKSFSAWLKSDLANRKGDWRLGPDKYVRKFRYVLETDRKPDEVLASAEEDLKRVHREMYELALPLHDKWFAGHPKHPDEKTVIVEVLDKIARQHATPETYLEDARKDLDEARAFVKEKGLLPLPTRDNLKVIPTPEFMRGIYAVGGFQPAPPLEPRLGAFYWVTPIPKNWRKRRIESKLREYNFYKLKLLSIHEAMPGHYVQAEYANEVKPDARRIVRSVFGNGPYVEGWAQYATQMLLDAGFLNNSPELRLTFKKEELRVLGNAILDVRLHTKNMTDQQALDLMLKDTFQENEEATAKLQRAKLSSCQLPTYFVGWRDWMRVRDQARKAEGNRFRLADFNERALKEGAVPLPVLSRLLTGKALGE